MQQKQGTQKQLKRRDRAAGFLEPLEGRLCMASVNLAGEAFGSLTLDVVSTTNTGTFAVISGRLGNGNTVILRTAGGDTLGASDATTSPVYISFYDSSSDSATWNGSGQLVLQYRLVQVNSFTAGVSGSTSNLSSTKKKPRAPKVVAELPTESRRGENAGGAAEQQASAVVAATEAPEGFALWADVEDSTLASSFFASAGDADADNTFVAAAPGDARGGMLGSADSSAATTAASGSLVQQFLAATATGAARGGTSAFANFSSRAIAADIAEPVAAVTRVGVDVTAALKVLSSSAAAAIRSVTPAVAGTTGAELASAAAVAAVPPRVFGYTHLNLPYAMLADSLAAFADESASVSTGTLVIPPRVDPPWALTFGVLAADLVALAYIHRERIKSKFARPSTWLAVAPSPSPAL